jgi:hypothetical protein
LARATSFGPSFYLFYAPFYLVYWLLSQYAGIHYDFALTILLKIPPLIGDIISTYALYEIGLHLTKDANKARLVAVSYFLNPYVIWITAVVGHAEGLWVAFVLLSMVYLIKGEVTKSGITFGIATLFRELPLLLLPFFIFFAYRRKSSLRFFKPFVISTAILALPFAFSFLQIYTASPPLATAFLQHFIGTGSAVQGTGSYGIDSIKGFTYNFTGILASFGTWPFLSQFFGFSHLLIVIGVLAIVMMVRGTGDAIWLNRMIVVSYSLLYLFTPLIQNEYLSWILPFVMIETIVIRTAPNVVIYVLTFTSLLIDPITQGGFFYYTLATFPVSDPSTLTGQWPLNLQPIYQAFTAPHALTVLLVASLAIIATVKRRGLNV